jgi:membrane-bound lytic murein transglycosylase D
MGMVPDLFHGRVARGADVLNVSGVRSRFDSTPVLGLVQYDHASVRAYLDFFDGRGKPILARWIARMGRYEAMIRELLKEAGLPEDLIFVAMIESGFSPRATSPAAAVGVWQFIPTTGSEMGLRIDRYVDERRDPVKATHAAIRYLKRLYERFGSWPLALAAYNGGPGLVSNTIKRYNTNDYWHIQRQGGMYDETRRYVPKVLAAGLVTKNVDIFGLDHVKPVDGFVYDVVEVPGNTRLQVVAEAAGTAVDVLRELNPELLVAQTPPDVNMYELRIPLGKTPTFVSNFDKISLKSGEHELYTVRFGETIDDIALTHRIPPRVLRTANGLKSRERVSYGAEIVIPQVGRGTWTKKVEPIMMIVPPKTQDAGKTPFFYRVNAGDSLETVARGLNVRASDILVWNFLDASARLQPGMTLQVFLDKPDLTRVRVLSAEEVKTVVEGSAEHTKITRRPTAKVRRHKVRSGESLWTIARKYKVTVAELKRWNRIKKNTLQPGQTLVIRKSGSR